MLSFNFILACLIMSMILILKNRFETNLMLLRFTALTATNNSYKRKVNFLFFVINAIIAAMLVLSLHYLDVGLSMMQSVAVFTMLVLYETFYAT